MEAGSAVSADTMGEPRERIQFVLLRVSDQEFGLPAETVIEVVRMVAIRTLPESPAWISGVITYRGRMIPIIDLRRRFGLSPVTAHPSAHIVIVRSTDTVLGLVVDAAERVLDVEEDAVEPPGEVAGRSRVIAAVARADGRLFPVLDVDGLSLESVNVPLNVGPQG